MYLAHGALETLTLNCSAALGGMLVSVDRRVFALSDASGSKRVPQVVSAELLEDGEVSLGAGGVAQRLLAGPNPPPVLDGAAFVDAASALGPQQLRACLENCLLECTNTRAARPEENSVLANSKLNVGLSALVQHLAAGSSGAPGAAGSGAAPDGGGSRGTGSGDALALFPASAGLPSLGALLPAVVLPPSATSRLISPPAAQLFGAHSHVGAGRRWAAELFEIGTAPNLHPRGRSHVRSAARRGGRYYCLLSGVPVWHHFDLAPPAGEAEGKQHGAAQEQPAAEGTGKSKARQPRQQQRHKRKRETDASRGAQPPSRQRRQGAAPAAAAPCTLRGSACSCAYPDLGVLWCAHRCGGMAGLLSDPGLHVLDCDALEALLAPLSPRQLAQLLLTVAFAGGTLPDVVLSLQLAPAALAALFLRRLGSLPLPVPLAADLRMCCYSPADTALASYQASVGSDPYCYPHPARDGAGIAANPLQPAHTAMRLSVLSTIEGSVLHAVDRRVRPLSPELVWHLKGMGLDALDLFPETVGLPNAAGIWPTQVRCGVALCFEDALGLARALGMLGSGYASVALELLKNLTATAAHPQYCHASLPTNSRLSFARRLAQLWQELTTPEQRWQLFMEGGMRLPAVWSSVVMEVAWQVVGQFPVLWALGRHLLAAMRGTSRAAAMALLTRGSLLLPRSTAGGGTSAFTDLLLFERSMQHGFTLHANSLASFLAQKQGQLRPAREGSLLQRAARSVAQRLLEELPLQQSQAAFQELILDLQEAVLAEAAALLRESAYSDLPAPAAQRAEAQLPTPFRTAGTVLKGHTVGVLNTGQAHNAEGLDRHALPAHLPPALASSPFNWVTLDVRAMLALPSARSSAACWAAAYLHLAPKYSPAGSVPLWAWLRQRGTLGLLLGHAVNAAERRDWHVAAMLADSAQKYINSSASLAAAAAATEHAQLQAARPLLRTLAAAAVAQLRSCMALLGAGGEAGNGGAILTHTSSLRACCLLLRAVLGLMGEALDPLLLQPGGALPGGPLGPHVLHMLALELPPNQLVDAQQAYIALHQVAAQHAANAMAAEGPAGGAPGQPQQQALPQEQPQGEQGDPLIQALAAQPPGPPTPAFAAAAAAAGLPLREPLPGAVQEALAADAIVLLQVAEVALELSHATLCAVPLLCMTSNVPSANAGSARHRQQQDTALWRASELTAEYEQYPYHHDVAEDGQPGRAFALNEMLLLLSPALLVALLPLLGQPATQRGAAVSTRGAGPSQRLPAGRITRGQSMQSSGAAAAAHAPHREQRPEVSLRGGDSLQDALLSLLPLADRLGTRLMEVFEEGNGRQGAPSPGARMKHSPSFSLVCSLLHLAAAAGGAESAARVAALPSAWKLLSSYSIDAPGVALDRPTGSHPLRLTHLALPTLLRMLRACTLVPEGVGSGTSDTAGPAAAAAAAPREQRQHQQAGEEEAGQAPAAKRRRRSSRPRKAATAGAEPSTGSAAAGAATAGVDAGRPAGERAAPGEGLAAASAAEQGAAHLLACGVQLDVSLARTAAARVLVCLTAGIQEHWRASNYALWRPRRTAPPPVAANAAGAGQAEVAAGAAAAAAAAQVPAPAQQQQQGPAGEHVLAEAAAQPAAAAGAAAEPPAPAAPQPPVPRPRQAFLPRQPPNSLLAAAFTSRWPKTAVEVLHWWLQWRSVLQPPDVGGNSVAQEPHPVARWHYEFQLMAKGLADTDREDCRQDAFPTLDGPVCLASAERSPAKLRALCATLLTLLCMECAPDVHTAAASALLTAAYQPGGAAELAECAPFWVLQRLLARGDSVAALPARLASLGRELVQVVEARLLEESGEWAAVLRCQATAAADAEAVLAERRAAALSAAAAAGNPPLPAHAGLNPLLPPPPPWFGNPPEAEDLHPYDAGMMGVHGLGMMGPVALDDFEDEEGDGFADDDELMFEEEVLSDSSQGDFSEGDFDDPWFF